MVELIKRFPYDDSYLFGTKGVHFRLSLEEAEQITRMINEEIQQRRLDEGTVERVRNVSPKEGMVTLPTEKSSNESSMDKEGDL
jgi:hypothetical protein